MLRDLLSSKAVLAGLVFFVIVVGGSLLYNWHVQRTIKPELARADPVDVPVSPYGFGPYPKVPSDFPFTPTWLWPEASLQNVDGLKYHELRFRVLIKLWNEGDTQFTGASINPDTSKVYPSYPNTVYLRYTGDGMGGKTVLVKRGPGVSKEDEAQIIDGNAPPGIQILDYDTNGIDPYTYLDLPSN